MTQISTPETLSGPELEKNLTEQFGPEGATAIQEGESIYQGYNMDDLAENPALGIEAAGKTAQLAETAIEGYIKYLQQKHISQQGLLKTDPSELLIKAEEKIFNKLPKSFFLIHIYERITSLINTLMAMNAEKYKRRRDAEIAARRNIERDMRRFAEIDRQIIKDGESPMLSANRLGMLLDEQRELRQRIIKSPFIQVETTPRGPEVKIIENGCFAERWFSIAEGAHSRINVMANTYRLTRDCVVPLFRAGSRNFEGGNSFDAETAKQENDRIFHLIKTEGVREVPMCTAENTTFSGPGTHVTIQFAPISEEIGRTHWYLAVQVNYHTGKSAKTIMTNKAAQEKSRPKSVDGKTGEAIAETKESLGFYLDRFTGELRLLGVFPEGLKLIEPSHKIYEFLRKDILFYLAQLTCTPETLVKIFGENFFGDPRKKEIPLPPRPRDPGENEQTEKEEEEKPKTDVAERQYPYGFPDDPEGKASAVFQVLTDGGARYIVDNKEISTDFLITPEMVRMLLDKTVRKVGDIVSHRRLLPLIRRAKNEEGKIIFEVTGACHPSEEAIEKAKRAGRILKKGIEFIELVPGQECVFYPEDVDVLLKKFGVETLEEIEERFPGTAFIRYETYVAPEKKEGTPPIIAHVRKAMPEAAGVHI
ncbi:MAG: hypothetical protein WC269_05185 [Candidatus Gracilibacteria bacterium]|jgi:hypothetical protein